MVQSQLKLRLTSKQEKMLNEWLWMLTGVWNFAVRKIELDAKDKIFYSPKAFRNLLSGHGTKLGIPSHTVQSVLSTAHAAWTRCFKKSAKKPRLKGQRNKLNSIPFPDPIRPPKGNRIRVPGMGMLRFHKMELPEGKIKCGRIVKRASGWYLCLFIDAQPKAIPHVANGRVGIDPGFNSLLTIAESEERFEKIDHPREYERLQNRLAQAQRGHDKKLTARLQERIANQRKDRNHKLSRRLVSENAVIRFGKDHHKGIQKTFGKSVMSSGHAQLRQMLAYKSRAGGRQYDEPDSKFSTMTCSACGARSGPAGWAGLSAKSWVCGGCGTLHDRDVNAAVNILMAGVGTTLEAAHA